MTAIPAVFSTSFDAFVPSAGPKRVRVSLCLLHVAQDKFVLFFFFFNYKRAEECLLCWTVTAVNVTGFILDCGALAEPKRRAVLIQDLRDRRSVTRKLYRCSSVTDVSVCE